MKGENNNGARRLIAAFGYSWQGLTAAWRKEQAFRQEVYLGAFLIPLALWVGENGVERAILVATVLLVILVEIINSAIESVVDRFGGAHHVLSGEAKDMGSAAVLISIVLLLVVWASVLLS